MSKELRYMESKLDGNFEKVNDEFLKCTVSVMCDSQIANWTKFTPESIDKALPTLNYAPVIGYFKDGDFKGHGIELVIGEDGFEEKVMTVPFGVVIKDSHRYENILKDNGENERYLVCDAYLWNRYKDAIDVVKENKCNQSMEVNINSGSYKDEYYEINDFSFSGICILGSNVTPAFNLAKIRTADKFSKDEFSKTHEEMTFALTRFLEGGDKMERLENETDEEFAKRKQCEDEEVEKDVVKEPFSDEVIETPVEENVVEEVTEEEVVEEEVVIDAKVETDFEVKYNEAISEINTLKASLVDVKSLHSQLESEVIELRAFKQEVETLEFRSVIDSVIDEFENLKEVDGFNEIFDKRYELKEEDLRIKLKVFAFDNNISLGKKVNFSKKDKKVITVPIDNIQTNFEEDPYGGLLDKFIKK